MNFVRVFDRVAGHLEAGGFPLAVWAGCFLQALAALPQPSSAALRRRRGPAGPEAFRLVE